MSHEVLITRRRSIFNIFANPGRSGPLTASAGWWWLVLDAEASSSLDLQKKIKSQYLNEVQNGCTRSRIRIALNPL